MKSDRNVDLMPPILYLLTISGALFFVLHQLYPASPDLGYHLLLGAVLLPIQALLILVVLSIHQNQQAQLERARRMNMVIGAFVFEVGTPLLRLFILFDRHSSYLAPRLQLTGEWTAKELSQALRETWEHTYDMDCLAWNMGKLKVFLMDKRETLLHLLENPNLVEHETFTDLLWAVNHLTDELSYRQDVDNLSAPDAAHLADDMRRAYFLLLSTWLTYLEHIQGEYPFLFSLVVRTNPFNSDARAEIQAPPTPTAGPT